MKTSLFSFRKKQEFITSVLFKKCVLFTITFTTLTFLLTNQAAKAQTYPAGFNQVLVANGISNPTIMAFAPDGRIFVAQQTGQLRVIKNGTLLATPFISLSVNSSGERGLLGIAFDPNFTTNKYIYLYYTLSSGANNRISRFTANGDVAVSGSEVVVLNLDPLSSATNHNGGTMQFGPDGKLYIGIGENANSANSQNLDTYLGKVLRINSDGSVPSGNPFTSGSAQRQRVWAYGVRNPYTITFQPGTGRLFVNDVGENTWEEIDDATTGGLNFGWPNAEGTSSNPAYANPVYAYKHGTGLNLGCAITGGTFFNPSSTNYPSSYIGKYFYIDYCGNWINMLTLSGSTGTQSNFASSVAGSPVSIVTGNDGNLYFLSRANSGVYKITYTGATAPLITSQPQSATVAAGSSVTFSVTATGTAPLNYQWRKNGTNITGATSATYTIASVTAANAGTYSVVVSNAAGSATSNNATLTVLSSTTLSPVADAFVRSGSFANTNYGSNTTLETKTATGASAIYQAYIRFDISSLSTNLTSVKLRLYGSLNNTNSPSASVDVRNVTSQTWQEGTITYANRPTTQTAVLATTVVTGTTKKYYEWDLTQHIKSLRNSGITSVSLLIKSTTTTANSRIIFNSKESSANKPQLVTTTSNSARPLPITEINDNERKLFFSAYPNPASDNFTLTYPAEFRNKKLQIIDVNGSLVKELMLTEAGMKKIATDNLKQGLYLLYIEMNNKKYVQKILIRK